MTEAETINNVLTLIDAYYEKIASDEYTSQTNRHYGEMIIMLMKGCPEIEKYWKYCPDRFRWVDRFERVKNEKPSFTPNIYCTLDTETFGGASCPEGIYHLAGIIHDRKGNVKATFNYLIMEYYDKIEKDSYAKKNFHRYEEMLANGVVTCIDTEQHAIEMVDALCKFYNVKYMMAYNAGFDFCKTACYQLLEGREFIDIWLMAVQTITHIKKYAKFCRNNWMYSASGKSVSTSAQSMYAYIINNPQYKEEHTALEDSKIEMAIFLACLKTHKKYTKNKYCGAYWDKNKIFPSAWED